MKFFYAVLFACCLLVFGCGQSGLDGDELRPGAKFNSRSALNSRMDRFGYLQVGAFGDSWPAVITEVKSGSGAVGFSLQKGAPQSYQGFEGYNLVMVRLQAKKGLETVVVYRSADPMYLPDPNILQGILQERPHALTMRLPLLAGALLVLSGVLFLFFFLHRRKLRRAGRLEDLPALVTAAMATVKGESYVTLTMEDGEFIRFTRSGGGMLLNLPLAKRDRHRLSKEIEALSEELHLQWRKSSVDENGIDVQIDGAAKEVAIAIRAFLVDIFRVQEDASLTAEVHSF